MTCTPLPNPLPRGARGLVCSQPLPCCRPGPVGAVLAANLGRGVCWFVADRNDLKRARPAPLALWERGWGRGCLAIARPTTNPVGASLLAMLLNCRDRQQAGSYKAWTMGGLGFGAWMIVAVSGVVARSAPLALWERGWGRGCLAIACPTTNPVGVSLLAMLLNCRDRQQAGSYKAWTMGGLGFGTWMIVAVIFRLGFAPPPRASYFLVACPTRK